MRRLHALALAAVLWLPGMSGAQQLRVAAPPETVFRWVTQRCDDLHVPDSPARALRLPDGRLALLAAHLTNVLLLGPDFAQLAPACATGGRGTEREEPAAFDDRFWVQALAPLPDGRILGLASHEYMGERHPGHCNAAGRPGFRCWYSSLIATVADPRSLQFRPVPQPWRVVAASPDPFDPAAPGRSGFFTASNIVFDGGDAYVLTFQEGIAGQRGGTCLLRAPRAAMLDGWRGLAGGVFGEHYGSAWIEPSRPRPCDPIGAGVFTGPVRSVVRAGPHGPWLAVFSGRVRAAGQGEPRSGVFLSRSADLLHWDPPELLWEMNPFHGQAEAGVYYEYPSLIDHASTSVVFDDLAGAPWLYLTRFNFEDRRRGMDRDLVRLRLDLRR